MKIDKIQCDICGKIVDYNDKKIGNMLSNKSFMHDQPCIDRGFYDRFKVNQLTMYGIANRKNVQEFLDKETHDEDVIINIEFDLCEECLIDLYKMINEWKNQRSEKNEFSS
jgi:hypothetical protein